MKKIFLGLVILFLMASVFAADNNVSITPTDLNISQMYGGESLSIPLTITNNFDRINSVIITVGWTDSDNNTTGFDAYLSSNNFQLYPNQSKDVALILVTKDNIKPGTYNINIYAEGTGVRPDSPPPNNNGGYTSGYSYTPRTTIDDTNDINDNITTPPPVINPPVIVIPPKRYDGNGCVIGSDTQWCSFKNRCIDIKNEECIPLIIDGNGYDDSNVGEEYDPTMLIIGFIIIVVVGIAIIIYKYKKGGKNHGTRNTNTN